MGKEFACCPAWRSAFGSKKSKHKNREIYERDEKFSAAVSSFEDSAARRTPTDFPPTAAFHPSAQDIKLNEANVEQSKHAYSVALATAAAAEAAVAAAQAAAEVVRLATVAPRPNGRSKEEVAAIRIQAAFRGYLARRALRALKGLVRLKTLISGPAAKRQSFSTLRAMQSLTRMQAQIRARRVRMTEENLALQRQLQQKHMKELEKLRSATGGQWDDSTQSKEKLEANIIQKQEAAMRRERALAYSFSHQQAWKNSSRSVNTSFIDPTNPNWGWCWLERWTSSRPWEARASPKSSSSRISTVDIVRAYAQNKSSRASSVHAPSTPPSRTRSVSSVTSKAKVGDEDSRSLLSAQSEQFRRHSIATSSVRDDESFGSSPSVPSYMAPTQSAKAKSRLSGPPSAEKSGISESAKKRLSFSASPGVTPRRLSGPPRVDGSLMRDVQASEGKV